MTTNPPESVNSSPPSSPAAPSPSRPSIFSVDPTAPATFAFPPDGGTSRVPSNDNTPSPSDDNHSQPPDTSPATTEAPSYFWLIQPPPGLGDWQYPHDNASCPDTLRDTAASGADRGQTNFGLRLSLEKLRNKHDLLLGKLIEAAAKWETAKTQLETAETQSETAETQLATAETDVKNGLTELNDFRFHIHCKYGIRPVTMKSGAPIWPRVTVDDLFAGMEGHVNPQSDRITITYFQRPENGGMEPVPLGEQIITLNGDSATDDGGPPPSTTGSPKGDSATNGGPVTSTTVSPTRNSATTHKSSATTFFSRCTSWARRVPQLVSQAYGRKSSATRFSSRCTSFARWVPQLVSQAYGKACSAATSVATKVLSYVSPPLNNLANRPECPSKKSQAAATNGMKDTKSLWSSIIPRMGIS